MKQGSVLGGSLLVSGTCIGAGALALPVQTGSAGFFPALLVFFLAYLFMAATGLLFAEVSLWLKPDANIVSMSATLLGKWGKGIAWFLYLYLFYSLTVAYISGSGDVIGDLTNAIWPRSLCIVLFVLFFGFLVYLGPRAVDRTNIWLVLGLGVAYAAFLFFGLPHIQPSLLLHTDWGQLRSTLLVVIVSFGYQGIVPTLTTYLGRDPQRVRKAILIGSFLPLLAYIVWELLILGLVPLAGLEQAASLGMTGVQPLRYTLQSSTVFIVAEFFAFFALTSSFLGVALAMRDFLADGLRIAKDRRGRFALCLLVFGPALVLALIDPRFFLLALRYGGGVGVALLLGLLPILLVWRGRYQLKKESVLKLPGGRFTLLVMLLFVVVWLAAELLIFKK